MSRLLVLLLFLNPMHVFGSDFDTIRPLPNLAIKLNVIPFSVRYFEVGVLKLQMGLEKKIKANQSILAELGYGSSFGGSLLTRTNVEDFMANVAYRKYFRYRKVSKQFWTMQLTQDLYSRSDYTWICQEDCLYHRKYTYNVQDWRSGVLAGYGMLIHFNDWLSLDFDINAGFYIRQRKVSDLASELDQDRVRWGLPQDGSSVIPHFLHRIRLSIGLY